MERVAISPSRPELVAFGPFRLNVAERLLEKDGATVFLRSRALDLLIALVEGAGAIISKDDLIARVWQDVTIEEVGLRVHIANLRKALGDGRDGARYIINVAGRGYSFVAPLVSPEGENPSLPPQKGMAPIRRLPPVATGMVGREEEVASISQAVQAHRFVTITGPGGIGKTTVAVAVGHNLAEEFPGGLYFVDLTAVTDPNLVPGTLVSALGGTVPSGDPMTSLLSFLLNKQALVLLDNCEHVIEAAAAVAEKILQETCETCIVTTSREPLRGAGEHIHRLSPLACPSSTPGLAVGDAMTFPAVRLFVERASAADDRFELGDADTAAVASLCQMLDGIPLTIELAASQVATYGLQGLTDLIDDRLGLLVHGRRTAPPRHQTLQALIDWSYNLLSPLEQNVLRHLSRFSARFTLGAVKAVVAGRDADLAPIAAVLSSLVSKSLVSREIVGRGIRYRLLDTTREYASAKLKADGDVDLVARRHAIYLTELLEAEHVAPRSTEERWFAQSEYLGDMRAALEWSFSERGDRSIAKALAQKAAPLFHELSLLSECIRWAQQALALLGDEDRGSRIEMELQSALAVSQMFIRGNSEDVRQTFMAALSIAERLGEAHYELRLSGGLHIFTIRTGDFLGSLQYAKQCASIADRIADSVFLGLADAMLSEAYHMVGDHSAAQRHVSAALAAPGLKHRIHAVHFGYDLANRAQICWARLQWLRGYPDQAVALAQENLLEAAELEHPVTLCISLIWTLRIFFWVGNLNAARESIDWFSQHYERHHLAVYYGVSLGLKGELAIHQGDTHRGIKLIRESLAALRINRYGLLVTPLTSTLVEGLAASGDHDEALATVDRQIAAIERSGELFYMPDLLRIKGDIQMGRDPDDERAEMTLLQSMAWSRRHDTLSWELRSATSLAQFYTGRGEPGRAAALLGPVYDRFTEGFETADLVRARRLLDTICEHQVPSAS